MKAKCAESEKQNKIAKRIRSVFAVSLIKNKSPEGKKRNRKTL